MAESLTMIEEDEILTNFLEWCEEHRIKISSKVCLLVIKYINFLYLFLLLRLYDSYFDLQKGFENPNRTPRIIAKFFVEGEVFSSRIKQQQALNL